MVANCVIFHNVFSLSRVLHDLQGEGYPLEDAEVAALSPYVTQHLNRFGRYDLDMEKQHTDIVESLRQQGEVIDDETLSHISLLPFRHVVPNGTYFIEDF